MVPWQTDPFSGESRPVWMIQRGLVQRVRGKDVFQVIAENRRPGEARQPRDAHLNVHRSPKKGKTSTRPRRPRGRRAVCPYKKMRTSPQRRNACATRDGSRSSASNGVPDAAAAKELRFPGAAAQDRQCDTRSICSSAMRQRTYFGPINGTQSGNQRTASSAR